jgi:hypothetical protein
VHIADERDHWLLLRSLPVDYKIHRDRS